MATKRTAGLLAACVVAAVVAAGLLTTCEETVNSPPESRVVAPSSAAAETATTKPVAPRRVRAAKSEETADEATGGSEDDVPIERVESEPFVVVPVEVVDAETGQPIGGATVSNKWKYPRQWAVSAEDAVTNESGRAAAHLRPAALNRISTRAAAHVPSTDLVRTAPVGSAQPTLRIELAPGGELRGIVYDPNGKPVEGAVVDVRRDDVDDVLQSEESGADGSYVVEGLVLGASHTASTSGGLRGASEYCGSANSPPLVPTREHPVVVADHRLRRYGTIELTVLDGDEPIDESLRLRLVVSAWNDGGSFRSTTGSSGPLLVPPGRVTLRTRLDDRAPAAVTVDVPEGGKVQRTIHLTRGESISGLVVDDTGAPVEDAWVRDGMSLDDPTGHRADARTGADGRFELELLAARDHRLTVSPPFEYEDALSRSVPAPTENVRFVVQRRGVLRLRAVFDDAKPAADSRIALHGTLYAKPWDIDRLLPRDGRFEIAWPQDVDGDVGIAIDGFVPVTRSVTVPGGTTVDLGEIRMQPACALSGVLLGADGAPLKEATLVVRGAMGDRKCKTDAGGRFSICGLSSGALRLDLAEAPHASFRVDVPSVTDVVLVVPRSGLLQVFASNASGLRLAARRVDVIDADGVTVDGGSTDANGSWTSSLAPGRYAVRVENGPHADADVRADDVTVLRLR